MIKRMINYFRKPKKVDPPGSYAIIKVTDLGKENFTTDDPNKIIELNEYGKITIIKYSDADVEVLETRGIPVLPEEYTEVYQWTDVQGGGIEYFK